MILYVLNKLLDVLAEFVVYELPVEFQTVEVFLYLMKFSNEQLKSDKSIELRLKDRGKRKDANGEYPILTSDEFLYEISNIKKKFNAEILYNVKQSAIDCLVHSKSSSKEKIDCFVIGDAKDKDFMYNPDIKEQKTDKSAKLNEKKETVKLVIPKIFKGTNYKLDMKTGIVYEYTGT